MGKPILQLEAHPQQLRWHIIATGVSTSESGRDVALIVESSDLFGGSITSLEEVGTRLFWFCQCWGCYLCGWWLSIVRWVDRNIFLLRKFVYSVQYLILVIWRLVYLFYLLWEYFHSLVPFPSQAWFVQRSMNGHCSWYYRVLRPMTLAFPSNSIQLDMITH